MPPQVNQSNNVPPPPPGYTLDNSIPPPPPGYQLDDFHATGQFPASTPPKDNKPPQLITPTLGDIKDFGKDIGLGALKSGMQTYLQSRGIPSIQSDEPQGFGQHTGSALEQTGEMMLTGGPLREAAVGTLSKLPFLGRYMAPGARVAAEAANTASNASTHGQDPNVGALAGAGGAFVGEMLPFLRNSLKESAEKQYAKVLNPTTQRNKNITQAAVPELLDRNVVTTEKGLQRKAEQNVENLGQQIDQAVKNVPASVQPDTQGIIGALDKYKRGFIVNGVPVDQGAVKAASDLQDMVRELGPDISYQSLNRVRQILDSGVARSGGYTGKTLAEGSVVDAQREAANAIRRELARQSPDIAKINAEFHLWKGVQDVMQATAERRTGQAGGLIHNLLPFLGASAGIAHHGVSTMGGIEGGLYALAISGIDSAVRSGAWRTASAVTKNAIADAIASGKFNQALAMTTRLGAAGASSATTPQENTGFPNRQAVRELQAGR